MTAERANKVLEEIGSTMRVTTADHIDDFFIEVAEVMVKKVESKIKELEKEYAIRKSNRC